MVIGRAVSEWNVGIKPTDANELPIANFFLLDKAEDILKNKNKNIK